ncbi:serine hydrolase family protein [Phreatobacter aquaticus]|uniref:Serine hydrolase family protein n=1 Tax=Phreatobacter aquaticus TaxID=2570229 RepID=A0A4D7QK60_9HYPH|nr:alpha/beta hydrolase [Phreatobacter aquaticus]QCK87998.1 serine hydrolase family protein [Phreatobacter aquaticus]
MRTADADILIVPGYTNSGDDHWQSRWEAKLPTAHRVALGDFHKPERDRWVDNLATAVASCSRPVILVAHSLGVVTVAHAAPLFPKGVVRGGFLVGLPDIEQREPVPNLDPAFLPIPRAPLPFPSVLVASRNDPHSAYERAEDFSYAWGSALSDAGEAGHMNSDSGHGPWPEGLMRFAGFLRTIG